MLLENISVNCSYSELLQSIKIRIWSSGKSQKFVADALKIDPGNFSKILTGVIVPSAKTMLSILDFVTHLPINL